MNLRLLALKVLGSVRQDGVLATLKKVRRQHGRYSRRSTVEEQDVIPLWALTIPTGNARYGERYQTTRGQELKATLDFLKIDSRNMTFIDLGCGKGMVLCEAARLGFRHVVGVEFARELIAAARANTAGLGKKITLIEGDAADYRFPDGELVVYLYNPFEAPILRRVLNNLRVAPAERVFIIYVNPVAQMAIDAEDFTSSLGHPPDRGDIATWLAVPQNSPAQSRFRTTP